MAFLTQLMRLRSTRRKLRAWPQHSLARVEVLSPQEFVNLYQTAPWTIKSANVLPVQLGSSTDFGNIVVLREPSYKSVER
jgi:hypothetical protein